MTLDEPTDESDDAPKLKGAIWLLALLALGAAMAIGIGPLVRAVPWRWETRLAAAIALDPPDACTGDAPGRRALDQLVRRLYPVEPDDGKFTISVHPVRSPIVNAYAGLGGAIVVNSGLLKQAESPEELAGVLAHEIGHVHHRDVLQGVVRRLVTAQGIRFMLGEDVADADWANTFVTMSFSRDQEAKADEDGLRRLQAAHIDNTGFRRFFERMENDDAAPDFLSDHPSNESRLAMVKSFVNQTVTPIMSRADWLALKNYCGPERSMRQ